MYLDQSATPQYFDLRTGKANLTIPTITIRER